MLFSPFLFKSVGNMGFLFPEKRVIMQRIWWFLLIFLAVEIFTFLFLFSPHFISLLIKFLFMKTFPEKPHQKVN